MVSLPKYRVKFQSHVITAYWITRFRTSTWFPQYGSDISMLTIITVFLPASCRIVFNIALGRSIHWYTFMCSSLFNHCLFFCIFIQASEDARRIVEEERSNARIEIDNARAAVQKVEQLVKEQEIDPQINGKQVGGRNTMFFYFIEITMRYMQH